MADLEAKKKSRKARKGALSREINYLRRLMAEDSTEGVSTGLPALKDKFAEFEKAHDAYHSYLTEEKDIDESDEYFLGVENDYIDSTMALKTWLAAVKEEKPKVAVKDDASSIKDLSAADFITMANIPNLEIESFDGNPMKYHNFMSVFDEQVHKTRLAPSAKLARLIQCTTDRANFAIQACAVLGDEGYEEARVILKKRFGSSFLIADAIIKSVKVGEQVRTPADLLRFSDELLSCKATLASMGKLKEIDTQASIIEILKRLQPFIRNRWKRKAMEHKRDKDSYPDFEDFVKFVAIEAEEATDPVYGSENGGSTATFKPSNCKGKQKLSTSLSSNVSSERKFPSCCACSGPRHRLFLCESFKSLKPAERLQLVRQHHLCENCFMDNHTTLQCRKPSFCSVPGCGMKHSKFVHIRDNSRADSNYKQRDSTKDLMSNQVEIVHACSDSSEKVMLPVVKVCVNNMVETGALLDNGSTNTFCTERLVNELGIKGTVVNYKLSTLTSSKEEKRSVVVDLDVKSSDGQSVVKLSDVYVVKDIPVHVPQIDLTVYSHLNDLPDNICNSVDVLIGQCHAEALLPIETRQGRRGEPFAVRTMLGWSLNGPVPATGPVSKNVISNFVSATTSDIDLQKLWDIEGGAALGEKLSWSKDDKRVIDMWDKQVKLVNGHYELPIPWKPDVQFPNNYAVAASRLNSLQKNLCKKGLTDRYQQEINKLFQHGYAEIVPDDELHSCNKTWYLPHQAVINEKKPEKLRIVFDCASKHFGESLNDKVFQGPDINNKLLDVLLRFRQHQFAIMADVEAMYNQVMIPLHDRDVLRFLWPDQSGNIVHYRMTRHLFGGIWCSASSTYALRRVTVDNEIDEINKDSICKSFYVDDCLQSVATENEVVKIVSGNQSALAKGGFRLTKFVTNSDAVLQSVAIEDRAKEVKDLSYKSKSKVLGICWDVDDDMFCYNADVRSDCVTKRSMLSIIASQYDPLGLVSPALVLGRMLFQETTRLKLKWDDELTSDLLSKWKAWTSSLADLHLYKLPRCIKPTPFDDGVWELHHFSDASMKAYGSCSYIRCINKQGDIHTSLIMSRCRLSPVKPVTIPRLELQAAVLSAKADSHLRTELDLPFLKSYFWTDSQIVLCYLKNEHRRFQVFVGNRVALITSLTSSDSWQHVRSEDNPADMLSRGEMPKFTDMAMWIQGPKFLRAYKSEWPEQPSELKLPSSDPEVKPESKTAFVTCANVKTSTNLHPIDVLAEHYSNWSAMKRAVAWWMRLRQILVTKDYATSGDPLLVSEVRQAETTIIRHVQSEAYSQDLDRLTRKSNLSNASHLRDLQPFLNDKGLLCVGGRIRYSSIGDDSKHPVIVPHKHRIAILIVCHFHNSAHLGNEWTLSLVRDKYWITHGRSVIQKVRRKCVTCKKLYGRPHVQLMSDLPPERVTTDKPPFTFIGIDCFGPFMVKLGRAEVKRYGCIFTCMNTRAVHIEKLCSLDTDAFLNGLRRFEARRGAPSKVFCDNGTNFVGASAELRRGLQKLDTKRLQSYGIQHEIEWHFNPPQASHMGGAWERMIGVVRRVFSAVIHNSRLTDEILETLFAEVESIVNSRPITKVSNHVDDAAPLTPNHLLLMRGGPVSPPGSFNRSDMYRRRWRYVQHLSDQFWRKWIKLYLPELQKRHKWLDQEDNVKIGDLVLILDENTPRSLWPMGLVTDIKVGRDGLVRSATVKTRSTNLVRPITKLVMLEG